jgi:hypothetical protein
MWPGPSETRPHRCFLARRSVTGDGAPGGTSLQFDVTKTEGNFPSLFVEDVCALAEKELSDRYRLTCPPAHDVIGRHAGARLYLIATVATPIGKP